MTTVSTGHSVLLETPWRPSVMPVRSILRTVWSDRLCRWGICLALVPLALAFFGPLIASDQPLVCRHGSVVYAPGLVDTARNIPIVGSLVKKSMPFAHPGFDAKASLTDDDWAIWAPIPFGPLEMTDNVLEGPSTAHLLGTDDRGRDVAARLIHGAAVSLRVGIASVLLAGVIGVVVGAVAGYYCGWTDVILSRVMEVFICFPALFLILAIMVWIRGGAVHVIVVIGLTRWTPIARLVRAELLKIRQADFVLAARCSGASAPWIITRHILPCVMAPVLVALAFGVSDAVMIEAGLSWLGFGVAAPNASWGNMLREAYDHVRAAPHLVYAPCAALLITVMAFHLIGEGLRRALDPRTSPAT